MHLCRNAWQRLAPLTQRGAAALLRNAPVRQMSSGSVPGSSGESLPYYLLVVVAFSGGGFYAYRTLTRDKERYRDRHEFIHTQLRPALDDTETKSKEEANAVPETIEEAVEAAIEEAAAEEVIEQEAAPTAAVEQEPAVAEEETASTPAAVEEETASAPTEQEPAAVEEETASAPTEQEPAPSAEAASVQVEPENTESVGETLEETTPVLEASSDNIIEELASAAEDWSELTARKPEETEVESAPAAEETTEVVEPEQASASS